MSYWEEKHSDETKAFQNECVELGHGIVSKSSNMFLVCVDGSRQSEEAYRTVMNLRRKFDHVCIFHAFRGDLPDLQPAYWRPNQLESKYDVDLVSHIPKRLYSMCFVDRQGDSVNTVLERAVDPDTFKYNADRSEKTLTLKPDFIVMGHHGRKGPKETKASIGSTADKALRNLHYPCLIVKNQLPEGARKIIMAVTDTNVSKRGLDILMRLVNSKDELILVHFLHKTFDGPHGLRLDAMRDYYDKELNHIGPARSRFEFVEYAHEDLSTAIVDYVNNEDVDLFAIAPRAKRETSSITDGVINRVNVSVLLCKI